MWKMNYVTKIEYVRDYIYKITFDNGLCGEVDFTEFLWGPVFEPLKDLSLIHI